MSTKTKQKRVNARPIVAAFTFEDVFVLMDAAEAYAAVLDVTDGMFPSPEVREVATRLRTLREELRTANAARSYIEENPVEGEGP